MVMMVPCLFLGFALSVMAGFLVFFFLCKCWSKLSTGGKVELEISDCYSMDFEHICLTRLLCYYSVRENLNFPLQGEGVKRLL